MADVALPPKPDKCGCIHTTARLAAGLERLELSATYLPEQFAVIGNTLWLAAAVAPLQRAAVAPPAAGHVQLKLAAASLAAHAGYFYLQSSHRNV